jgi:hypothetical protein
LFIFQLCLLVFSHIFIPLYLLLCSNMFVFFITQILFLFILFLITHIYSNILLFSLFINKNQTTKFKTFLPRIRCRCTVILKNRMNSKFSDIMFAIESSKDNHLVESHSAQIIPYVSILSAARQSIKTENESESTHSSWSLKLILQVYSLRVRVYAIRKLYFGVLS